MANALKGVADGILLNRLLGVFDRGFQLELARRWQSADELRRELTLLTHDGPQQADTARGNLWAEIEQFMARTAVQAEDQELTRLKEALAQMEQVPRQIAKRLRSTVELVQSGLSAQRGAGIIETRFAFRRTGSESASDWVILQVSVVGNEMKHVVVFGNEPPATHRTPYATPIYDERFLEKVEEIFLGQIHAILEL